jgi:hypothetical protein
VRLPLDSKSHTEFLNEPDPMQSDQVTPPLAKDDMAKLGADAAMILSPHANAPCYSR